MEAWLTPSAATASIGGVVTLIAWLIRQDRRLSKAEELESKLFGDGKNDGVLSRYQTREACGACRHEVDNAIHGVPSKNAVDEVTGRIRILEERAAEDRAQHGIALARIEAAIESLSEKIDALKKP